jgi:hypothetical protein
LKRRQQPREDRRRAQVEVNLLAESEGGKVITKSRRGCALPFFGSSLLVIGLVAVEGARAGLG